MARLSFAARILVTIVAITSVGLAVAVGIAVWVGATSTQALGQAAFYAGVVLFAVGALIAMPFQGVGGASVGGGAGMSDFFRMMTLTAAETDWAALHKQDKEHFARGAPVAVCLFVAGLLLGAGGVAVTWIAWSSSN